MAAVEGKPQIGRSPVALGVRVGGERPDISPDREECVRPESGGMSVSPSLRDLPPHRIPRRLRHLAPDARGKDEHFVWRMGEGPFRRAAVATGRRLRPDPGNPRHGLVEPSKRMKLDQYEHVLAATRDHWVVEEQ